MAGIWVAACLVAVLALFIGLRRKAAEPVGATGEAAADAAAAIGTRTAGGAFRGRPDLGAAPPGTGSQRAPRTDDGLAATEMHQADGRPPSTLDGVLTVGLRR